MAEKPPMMPTLHASEQRGVKQDKLSNASMDIMPNLIMNRPARGAAGNLANHPIETMQKQFIQNQEALNLSVARHCIGPGLPTLLKLERAAFNDIRRLPTLPSSMVALEISLGRNGMIDFQDYLNDPDVPEAIGSVATMMSVNPPGFN
eukprot:m.88486 g.88486  ORF g.88486 m.88486 type:complete len:148 (-) comp13167_c0_seq2:4272-4715(-)